MARVLASNRYILGEEVERFEAEFASACGVAFGVGVASGTDALMLALKAVGVGPGDEVITVSFTSVATVAAIEMAGAQPVLVDIEPDYHTIDPAQIERAVTDRTRAIVAVHLYGQPAALAELAAMAGKHGLKIIEDCAQAHGAAYQGRPVGSWGVAGCFSFYPTKNLGALGDGGMVVTNDRVVAARVRELRQYGWGEERVSQMPGVNSRLDELQASVLRVKLRHLENEQLERQRIARQYGEAFADTDVVVPAVRDGSVHAWHLYVVRTAQRDARQQRWLKSGIGAQVHYPVPVHRQPAYRGRVRTVGALAVTEQAAHEVLSLPIYPQLSAADVSSVRAALKVNAYELAR